MRYLVSAILQNKKHWFLLGYAIASMIVLAIASQVEMVSLGLLVNNPSAIGTQAVLKQSSGFLDQISNYMETRFHFYSDYRVFLSVLVCVSIFKAITLFYSRYLSQYIGIQVSLDLRKRYFKHIETLSMDFFHQHDIGMLSTRVVADASSIADSISSGIINYIQLPFIAITTMFTCAFISIKMFGLLFFCLPAIILPIVVFSKKVKKAMRRVMQNQEKFSHVLLSFLSGVQNIKLFCKEKFLFEKYNQRNEAMAHQEIKASFYANSLRPLLHMITTVFLGVFLFAGLYLFNMSIGDILVFCGLLYLFYEPIKRFADENTKLQKGVVAARRLAEIMAFTPSIRESDEAESFNPDFEQIEFKNIWFRYHRDQKKFVLKNMSFTLKKGQMVAIIGATGGGKSSVASLLPRLYDIEKGKILFDKVSIDQFTISSLREGIAFVTQKTFFFHGSVLENITFGQDIPKKQVVQACKNAHAHEFIEKLPQGYNTLLEDDANNLSGGQKQRLALARAFLKNSSLLVLDEATSQLDTLSEGRLKEALEDLKGKVTQIVIAHRLNLIENADLILLVDQGRVVAQGTKEELLATNDLFARMYEGTQTQESASMTLT